MTATTLPPPGTAERRFFMERMLDDTGFLCRNVLGMNTDRDERGNAVSEIGKGGVRDHGPHQEVVSFIDDETNENALLLAPRYSYKSSIITGFLVRMILRHPDIAILLCMKNSSEAGERCQVIRDILTTNPIIVELFGDLRGKPWKGTRFTTSRRKDTTLLSPTLWVGSPQKTLAGGRPNLLVFDDIVSENDPGSELKLKKGVRFCENALALRSRGARTIMVATPWDEADASQWAIKAGWKQLTHLDIGYDLIRRDDGTLDLEGKGRWPNLSIEHLRGMLRGGMEFEKFMSQFMLRIVRGVNAQFERHQFHPEKWSQEKHSILTGYLLCDTAPSGATDGDLNVLMYVGFDERGAVHILDLEVGHWKMYEFCDRYLNMLQKWQSRVNHRIEMWEKGHNYHSYFQHIQVMGRERNIRVTAYPARRNQAASVVAKDTRIALTAGRFQSRQVYVMDTVPRAWNAETEIRPLWEPEGFQDTKTGQLLPAGDLVEQFVRFPHHKRKDIPDTFALIETVDEQTGMRVCSWARPMSRGPDQSTMRNQPRPQQHDMRQGGSASRFFQKWGTR